jgi:chorismate mutase
MQHIYLRRAQQLRPDLSNLSPNGWSDSSL